MKRRTQPTPKTEGTKSDRPAIEQRKHPRLLPISMEIDISDRVGFSTGTVKDISRFGICIADIPRKLQTTNDCITVVISAKQKRFKLLLRPQWERREGLTVVTGTVIDSAPWDWTEMIIQMEPKNGDAWATN